MAFVDSAGVVHVAAGASHEQLTISRPVTLSATGGIVRLGDAAAPNGSGSPYERLRITEIMYNPADGGAEYLELQNTGYLALDVSNVYFSSGIDFTFSAGTILAPGEYVVLVRNTDVSAFLQNYSGVNVGGVYGGALSNSGETLSINDPSGNVFLSFTYNDAYPWPTGADGSGFSLVIVNPQSFGDSAVHWRASNGPGGAPGEADPDSQAATVVISEALTHTDLPAVDTVEFQNPSTEPADIRGWFLTDDVANPQKARVPGRAEYASIAPGGFAVIDESDFFGAPGSLGGNPLPGFRLSSHGEDIYLFSADAAGNLTGYVHGFGFGGAENGVSFGRVLTTDGREHFVPQTTPTLGSTNAGPKFGSIVISSIHYHPLPNGVEFVELTNTSGAPINLWDTSSGGDPNNTYRIEGIGFSFPAGTTMAGGGRVLVVDDDPANFISRFGDPGIPVYGPFENDPGVPGDSLSNGGETIRLQWPDTPDEVAPGVFEAAYISMDTVRFDNDAPWPNADGNGLALARADDSAFGSEPTNWTASSPVYQPGQGVSQLAFSLPRGFYNSSISLAISTATSGAQIRYTTDGSVPTESTGTVYGAAIPITSNTVIRAAAFKTGYLSSPVETHTYLINASPVAKSIPAISIAGDPGSSLYEPDGVMAIVGGHYEPEDDWYEVWKPDGPGDYNNPMQEGIAFERPISFELINPGDNSGTQAECGIRVQGSSWHRPRYFRAGDWTGCTSDNLNYAKFSFRLVFRREYGPKNLDYPIIAESILPNHDQIILRGGHNDTCDPFINDELARRLFKDMGYIGSVGMFAHVYIDGELKGFYNPVERLDEKFFQGHYPASGKWDVITHRSEVRDGDGVAWTALMNFALSEDLSIPAKYDQMAAMLDIDAFIDYLILELFTNNADWPNINWIAARERSSAAKWRFYVWDSEFAFRPDFLNNIGFDEYPQRRGAGLNGEETEIAWLYRALKANPVFSQRWAARVNLHLFGSGALAQPNANARYTELRQELSAAIPSMSTFIPDTFLTTRYGLVLDAFENEGLWAP